MSKLDGFVDPCVRQLAMLVPFLDLDLVGFAARIPIRLKQRGQTGKWVLKVAKEPYLRRDVIHSPKTGFRAPLHRWTSHDLRDLLGDLLSSLSLRRRGLSNPRAVQELTSDNNAGRRDAAYTIKNEAPIEYDELEEVSRAAIYTASLVQNW